MKFSSNSERNRELECFDTAENELSELGIGDVGEFVMTKVSANLGTIAPPAAGGMIAPPGAGGMIAPPGAGGMIAPPGAGGMIAPPEG